MLKGRNTARAPSLTRRFMEIKRAIIAQTDERPGRGHRGRQGLLCASVRRYRARSNRPEKGTFRAGCSRTVTWGAPLGSGSAGGYTLRHYASLTTEGSPMRLVVELDAKNGDK